MLRVAEYRSVPLRKVSMSPSRKVVMEVFLKQEPPQSEPQPAAARETVASSQVATSTPTQTPAPHQPSPSRHKVPIVNLMNFERVPIKGVLNSPRSIDVCEQMGITPAELLPKTLVQFRARDVPENIAALRYEHYEARRQEKLQMLRDERENKIRDEHQGEQSSAAEPNTAVGLLPAYTRSLMTDTKPTTAFQTPSPAAVRPNITARYVAQPSRSSIPSISDELRQQRAMALVEKENRRKLIYEKAVQIAAEKQFRTIKRAVTEEKKAAHHVADYQNQRQTALELQKLRRQDTFDHIRQQNRANESAKNKRSASAFSRSSSAVRVDPYQLSLAKAAYMTPRQRAERVRSASAQRG